MADVETLIPAESVARLNVADRLTEVARRIPDVTAIACPLRWSPSYRKVRQGHSGAAYATITFAELDADATRIARGLAAWGVPPGTRLALLVRPGIEFVTLVFALLRAGMVIVLADPGLGRRNLIRCLSEAEPEGFVAVSAAQAARLLLRHKFPRARWNVTVGRRWRWGGLTPDQLRSLGDSVGVRWALPTKTLVGDAHPTLPDDPAAIIFTSGSTGPPKGVMYTHRMFDTQVSEIQSTYGIEQGGVDLACFPLFALFNSAMGVTTVMPKMDFSRPASADPEKLLAAANDWQVTQAFASPAVWRLLSGYCAKMSERIESLQQVFSCGAPVSADVLRATLACVGVGAKMHTPFGATECLPVSTIEAAEVLGQTARQSDQGAGVCVGRKFNSIIWRVIPITDDPIATMDEVEELSAGEIGELIVRGPQVSPTYVTTIEANAMSKIGARVSVECGVRSAELDEHSPLLTPHSPLSCWHRTGDVGYVDDQRRFWYCGRKSQRVRTRNGPLFTEKIEAVFNSLPGVRRSALIGVGPHDEQAPVVVIEPEEREITTLNKESRRRQDELICGWYDIEPRLERLWYAEQGYIPLAAILFHPSLPVDVRHNAKINRELLANWAAKRLAKVPSLTPDP